MGTRIHNSKRFHGERGATFVIFTLSLFLLVGMGALGIDLASMYVARSESQQAADSAALAGAKYFVESGCVTNGNCSSIETVATGRATEVAGQSIVGGQPVTLNGAPTFNLAQAQNPQITVSVQSSPLRLYFLPALASLASVVGATTGPVTPITVGATATAEAYNPSGITGGPTYCTGCIRPWLIPNCDQTPGIGGATNGLCNAATPTPEAYLLTPGSYGVQNAGCTPAGVVGEQIEIPLPTPTTPGALPVPTTLYGAVDVDSPGTGNPLHYQTAITTCFTGETTCGQPTLNVLSINAALNASTQAGVENLLHVAATGLGLGQDYIDTTVCPPQIHAGASNPLVVQGVLSQDSVIATSDSIVSAYIYDTPPGVATYTGLTYTTTGVDSPQVVNIVGFAQIFVSQVDAAGNVFGNILGVAGCGGNSGGACAAGSGSGSSINAQSLIPVRLISPGQLAFNLMVTLPNYLQDTQRATAAPATWLRRVFSFPVLLGSVLAGGSFAIARNCILEPDMWWHVAVGQRILATHTFPSSDTYSSTAAGAPWIAYEWLGEVAMGAAASMAGLRSATLLLVLLSATLVALLYYYAIQTSGSSKAAFVAVATLIPTLGAFFGLRPQLIGMIFMVLTLILLEKFRAGQERVLWLVPPIFLLWVNTHGSFVFGFFVLGVVWLCGQMRFSVGGIFSQQWTQRQSVQLLLTILLSALMLPLTPYGTRIAAYPLSMAFGQPVNVGNIQEWQRLGTDSILGKSFMIVGILFLLACLVERPRFRVVDVALALFGVFAACTHLRFTLLFVIFFTPLWAQIFSRWMPEEAKEDHPWINAGIIAAIVFGIAMLFPSSKTIGEDLQNQYPVGAMQYLQKHPIHGQVLNDYGWGGYLIGTDQPKNMIFIDSRVDIYEFAGILSDYLSIMRLDGDAFKLLKKYNVEACLIKQDSSLATALAAAPGWERVYQDGVAAVYARKPLPRAAAHTAAQ